MPSPVVTLGSKDRDPVRLNDRVLSPQKLAFIVTFSNDASSHKYPRIASDHVRFVHFFLFQTYNIP